MFLVANTSSISPRASRSIASCGRSQALAISSVPSCAPCWPCGRQREEEARVEAPRAPGRGDPVAEVGEVVRAQQQPLALEELGERQLARVQRARGTARAAPRARRPARARPRPGRAGCRPPRSIRAPPPPSRRARRRRRRGARWPPSSDKPCTRRSTRASWSALSSAPPGNTCAPARKAALFVRCRRKASGPRLPSRSSRTVAAGRGASLSAIGALRRRGRRGPCRSAP